MRILLVEPTKAQLSLGGEDVHVHEPLALEYVAAGVADEHEVRILDLRLDPDLRGSLGEFHPHVVGITGYTVHVGVVRQLFEEIKAFDPDVLTVVGGHHATVAPDDFDSPFIDVVVRGEGVFTFREIVRRHGRHEDFAGIPGVARSNGRRQRDTEDPDALDLDAFPPPARHLTSAYRDRYYAEYMRPLASIRTSKGCPFRCSFCALWRLAHGRYYARRPEKVVEELATIDEECVFFADDESLVDYERMKTLAGLIRAAGLKKRYFLYGRTDTIARHPDLLELWREVGLERVFVGFEFFRDEDLRYVNKRSTLEDNERAARILRDLGIDIYASFILRPEYTREDFAALRRYCRELELTFAGFAVLTPLPGTELYEEVEERLLTRDTRYYDFIHTVLPTALPLEEFYREYYRLSTRAIPFRRTLRFLSRFRLKDLPGVLVTGMRWYRRLRNAWRDYEALVDPNTRAGARLPGAPRGAG